MRNTEFVKFIDEFSKFSIKFLKASPFDYPTLFNGVLEILKDNINDIREELVSIDKSGEYEAILNMKIPPHSLIINEQKFKKLLASSPISIYQKVAVINEISILTQEEINGLVSTLEEEQKIIQLLKLNTHNKPVRKGNLDWIIKSAQFIIDANKDYDNKAYKQAENKYLLAIKKGVKSTDTKLADIYHYHLKNYDKAIEYYTKRIEDNDKNAIDQLAWVYKKLGNFEKSKSLFEWAIKEGEIESIWSLANLYAYNLQNYTKAEEYYLLGIEKGNEDCLNSLAWLYYEQKKAIKKEEALHYAQQSIKHKNNNLLYYQHTLTAVYLWNDKVQDSLKVLYSFLSKAEIYEGSFMDRYDQLFYVTHRQKAVYAGL